MTWPTSSRPSDYCSSPYHVWYLRLVRKRSFFSKSLPLKSENHKKIIISEPDHHERHLSLNGDMKIVRMHFFWNFFWLVGDKLSLSAWAFFFKNWRICLGERREGRWQSGKRKTGNRGEKFLKLIANQQIPPFFWIAHYRRRLGESMVRIFFSLFIQGDSCRLVKTMRLWMLVATARWFLVAFKFREIRWRLL